MKIDPGSSISLDLHSKYKSIHVRNVLESNMERHCLITSQWCKLLTDTRVITDDDDDPQGTAVQFTWCERGTWRRTPCKVFQSKASDVNLSLEVRNLPLRHARFKVLKGLFLDRLPG